MLQRAGAVADAIRGDTHQADQAEPIVCDRRSKETAMADEFSVKWRPMELPFQPQSPQERDYDLVGG